MKTATAKRTTEVLTEQQLADFLQSNHFNEFELTSNSEDDVTLAIKCVKPYKTSEYGTEIAFLLDYDETIYDYISSAIANIIYDKNIGNDEKIDENDVKYYFCNSIELDRATNVITLKYGDIIFTLKCKYNPEKPVYYHKPSFQMLDSKFPVIEDLLHLECVNKANSYVDNNKIVAVLNPYKLGEFEDCELIEMWKGYYEELYNLNQEYKMPFVDIKDINGGAITPYIMYDTEANKIYMGIYSLANHEIDSKFELKEFIEKSKNKRGLINPSHSFEAEAKITCTLFAKSQEQPA